MTGTVRVLVEPPADATDGLAIAIKCAMDVYLRIPRDVVLVVPDPAGVAEGPLAQLVGADAAAQVAEGPQAFAEHTIRLIGRDDIGEAELKDTLVVVREATPDSVDAVEKHEIAALIVVPAAGADLREWATRTHADVVRAQG